MTPPQIKSGDKVIVVDDKFLNRDWPDIKVGDTYEVDSYDNQHKTIKLKGLVHKTSNVLFGFKATRFRLLDEVEQKKEEIKKIDWLSINAQIAGGKYVR